MKIYIYNERQVIKERVVLPNGKNLLTEFPSVINAYSEVSPFPENYNLRILIHKFYEKLSPDALEWLLQEEMSLLNQVTNITTGSAEEIKGLLSSPSDIFNAGMKTQQRIEKEIACYEGFEKFIDYNKILNNKLGMFWGQPANLESFLLESFAVRRAISLWLSKDIKENPSERFIQTSKIVESFCESTGLDISGSSFYKMLYEGSKNPEILKKMVNITNASPEFIREFSGTSMLLHKTYEERSQQIHTRIIGLDIERKKVRSTEKHSKDALDIQTDFNYQKVFSRLYTSGHGLLPLLWAEITYAIENDLFLKKCRWCKKWYVIKGKSNCCSSKCVIEFDREHVKLRKQKERAEIEEDKQKIQQKIDKLLKGEE